MTNDFIKAIGGKNNNTSTVYVDGNKFATYSTNIALMVFDDIKGKTVDVVSDQTGEILKHKDK